MHLCLLVALIFRIQLYFREKTKDLGIFWMNTLNTDCLSRIFLNLDFLERVRKETVCHLWRYVLTQHSTYADINKLDIATFLFSSSSEYYPQDSISFGPTIIGVVERCGPYVKELSFGQRWLRISQPIIDCITKHCRQVRVLDMSAVILNADIDGLLKSLAPKLEYFSLEETTWMNNEYAAKVQNHFKSMVKLKSINLRSASFALDKLDELPINVESLNISSAHRFSDEVFERFLGTHPNLRELHISPIPVFTSAIIDAIGQLRELETLSMGFVYNTDIDYAKLSQLHGIRNLHLQVQPVRASALNVFTLSELELDILLINMPLLTKLSIVNCKNIYDYSSLGVCSRLTELTIKDTMQFADDDLLTLSTHERLERLIITNCLNISTTGINYVLSRCQLKELVVNKCEEVTDEMLFTLSTTQEALEKLSVQSCISVTSKGVAAIGWLKNIDKLEEADVSRNRSIDDSVVIAIYNGLQQKIRRQEKESNNNHKKSNNHHIDKDVKKLILYIFETSISEEIIPKVGDLITIC